jgi:hypothetical protein
MQKFKKNSKPVGEDTTLAAARLYLFLISGGGLKIFKIFPVSAAVAVFFWEKSAAAAATQPIG